MAIRPKKQTPSNKGETGGGAPRGGASGNVRVIRGGSVAPRPKPVTKGTQKSGPTMRSTAKDKPLTARESATGNKRGLKAATGKSLAPKGYGPDTARREALKEYKAAKYPMTGAQMDSLKRANETMSKPGPTNIVSRSGRTARSSRTPK